MWRIEVNMDAASCDGRCVQTLGSHKFLLLIPRTALKCVGNGDNVVADWFLAASTNVIHALINNCS